METIDGVKITDLDWGHQICVSARKIKNTGLKCSLFLLSIAADLLANQN